ncbi:lysine exporter LysO family protein [uncultured Bacteroides sp.]|uniref:lysine exporter LysO family protein n=1 Tax=uncultured Bacteroides sp. TaxID=162156 RepID=UPI00261CA217|nr:lysine exporter LysO family protein [uncultured Bacteroides sp.]
MKGSLIIVGFFIAGTLCGVCLLIPADFITDSRISFYALCALMFCVGISIGNDPQTLKNFRSLNPRLVFLPVMTILGTLAGSAAVNLILTHRSLTDCLAVGSGFGYYSLSSIFITEYKGAELGTIALLANISREILTLLAAPLLAHWFGKLAPISAGGATSMDTTLPIITRTSGQQFVVVSIFHGFIVDFSVPFLVTLFCSL